MLCYTVTFVRQSLFASVLLCAPNCSVLSRERVMGTRRYRRCSDITSRSSFLRGIADLSLLLKAPVIQN